VINRIRDIRKQKGLTLADVAERCSPPTTAQTIGRLETGMRQLSLTWMNKIAAALEVEPELLVRGTEAEAPRYIARFTENGAEALPAPRDAILPTDLGGDAPLVALAIIAAATRSGCVSTDRSTIPACSIAMSWPPAPAAALPSDA
jgi:transcriptional regulator with XRE-family HTH domain